ncbi:DNA mismatch repair endonuclease MutL [Fictibacillus phosphorivorans]|uniref:DNA mismatch repair endonuclease MutL n=1 Tax=Fictibacillus phosphorivorans TaxID=1221500 RepID=UPI00203D9F23|nr:DNA mismatch repair endonuclease MutL [Fictibacillus phosphorivorans]MCM3717076.1 DNA mismatch repair endonuclease MutL [Fictibacillus phosphorivorans]MCM3774763.1 DNA mismatch repair endonuclease MutL [Fictibacillus phosphorivorans]
MGKIVQLDEHLSNKIAAGEVVERPASVVKELVENSIDANASRIEIEIEEGGLSLIRVLDNGDGIEEDDCVLAFNRHATSKIKSEHDLIQIRTMGFRGEALPSIASVSQVELKSSTGDRPGTYLFIENGIIKKQQQTNSRKGTDLTVRNLFYNTPARLKHVKTIQTELGTITDLVNRLALANPNVSFRLKHNGKELLQTSGNGNVQQIIAAVYGIQTAKNMLPVSFSSLDYEVTGYISKPETNRASRQYISLFMNGRYIKNYALSKAVQNAYHTFLPIGRFPIAVLSVKMDPTIIDVNVHPSKHEARLSKETELVHLVENELRKVIKAVQLIPEVHIPKKEKKQKETGRQSSFSFEYTQKKQYIEPYRVPDTFEHQTTLSDHQAVGIQETVQVNGIMDTFPDTALEKVVEEREEKSIESESQPQSNNQEKLPVLYPIGQMHGTYILAQNENGLYLIDQHAAQERIKYEYFREKVGMVERELQLLTVPYTFEYTTNEAAFIHDHLEFLSQVGLFLEPFGQNTFIVREHPQWFPKGYEKETIMDIIQQVLDHRKIDIEKLREEAAIMMSCKGSIKANHHLRNDEIFALLETLRESEDPYTCPHGRPITIHLSTYELEKMFKRVM